MAFLQEQRLRRRLAGSTVSARPARPEARSWRMRRFCSDKRGRSRRSGAQDNK